MTHYEEEKVVERDGAKIEKNKIRRSVMYACECPCVRVDFNDRIFQKKFLKDSRESLPIFEPHPSKTGSVNAVAHA